MITLRDKKIKANFPLSMLYKKTRKKTSKDNLVVILGPTSSGKSDLAVRIAKKFNGEVISADSRQVYKRLDLGTGKITKKEMLGVPHHMIDIVSPKSVYSAGKFKKDSKKIINKIARKDKLPIIAGGSGFYIDSLIYGLSLPDVKADLKLRKSLMRKSAGDLYKILKKLDSVRARTIDPKNKVRIARAIEIAKSIGKVPKIKKREDYRTLLVGIDLPDKELRGKIKKRLLDRLRSGMVAEAKKLHRGGLSFKRMEELGLEYRYLSRFLKKEINKQQLIEKLGKEIWRYAKRQRTWWKRNKNIKWFRPSEYLKIKREVSEFLRVLK